MTDPSPTRPDRDSEQDADEAAPPHPDPNDASGLGGLLGVAAGDPPTGRRAPASFPGEAGFTA